MATQYENKVTSDHPVQDAVTGTDQPLEKEAPGATPALVFLSYPIFLAVAMLVAVAVMYFTFR